MKTLIKMSSVTLVFFALHSAHAQVKPIPDPVVNQHRVLYKILAESDDHQHVAGTLFNTLPATQFGRPVLGFIYSRSNDKFYFTGEPIAQGKLPDYPDVPSPKGAVFKTVNKVEIVEFSYEQSYWAPSNESLCGFPLSSTFNQGAPISPVFIREEKNLSVNPREFKFASGYGQNETISLKQVADKLVLQELPTMSPFVFSFANVRSVRFGTVAHEFSQEPYYKMFIIETATGFHYVQFRSGQTPRFVETDQMLLANGLLITSADFACAEYPDLGFSFFR